MPKLTEATRRLRRERIATAALRCFARSGFAETSMADIIAESGMSAGSIYSHFASKAELIRFVSADVLAARADEIRRGADASHLVTPGDVFANLAAALTDPARARVLIEVWAVASRDPELDAAVQERMTAARELIADTLAPWARTGADDGTDPDLLASRAADVVFIALQGLIARGALDRDGGFTEVRGATAAMLGCLDPRALALAGD